MLVAAALALPSARTRAEEPAPEIRPVRTIKIEQRAGTNTVALTGTAQAETEINQSFCRNTR